MFVAVEHFLAEPEERHGGHVVVLEDDAFVGDGESPFLRQEVRGVASAVPRLVVAVYGAWPVDVFGNAPAGFDARHVVLAPRSVLVEEQPCGLCLSDFGPQPSEVVGAVEEEDEYGDVGHACSDVGVLRCGWRRLGLWGVQADTPTENSPPYSVPVIPPCVRFRARCPSSCRGIPAGSFRPGRRGRQEGVRPS